MKPITKLTSKQIGDLGEKIVFDLLSDAIHINNDKEQRLAYDILWKGIRIDVKTSLSQYFNPTFNLKIDKRYQDIILVFILIRDAKNYFWVERYSNQVTTYKNLKTAIEENDLAKTILTAINSPDYPITLSRRVKPVNITTVDWEEYSELAKELTKKLGFPVSIPNVIRRSVSFYKENNNG